MRDHGITLEKGIIVSTMFNDARKREPLILKAVIQHHPEFSGARVLSTEPMPRGIEGGDVLVLNRDTLLVGLSQRTTEQAIETLAQRLLIEEPILKQVLVMQIPIKRAYMHLDTVFTMVDYDKFLFFPGIRDMVYMYRLSRGAKDRVHAEQLGSIKMVWNWPWATACRSSIPGAPPVTRPPGNSGTTAPIPWRWPRARS